MDRNGKITFNASMAYKDTTKEVSCGQCIGCKLDRSREWAARCVHEAQMHEQNCSITLTYAPEHLPPEGSLDPTHTTLFLKRLRKHITPHKISYLYCGEYGDNLDRPHYHVLLFGYEFPDKKFYKKSKSGDDLYTSDLLEKLWGLGNCAIGDLTFDSAAYACRYSLKKITGDSAPDHYRGKLPEFIRMSTKPALGARWYAKYGVQTHRHDSMVVNGAIQTPPRYYDKLLRRSDPEHLENLKKIRTANAGQYRVRPVDGQKKLTTEQRREQTMNRSKKRLAVLEESAQLRAKLYKRNL